MWEGVGGDLTPTNNRRKKLGKKRGSPTNGQKRKTPEKMVVWCGVVGMFWIAWFVVLSVVVVPLG